MSEIRSILREMREQRREHDRELVEITEAQMNLETAFTLETMMTGMPGEVGGVGIAWMFQRRFDHLEEHAIQIEGFLRDRFGIEQSDSHRYWAANEEARGDLYAALMGLTDEDLDEIPIDPPGEWPLRTTLEHTLDVEHSYRDNTLWAVEKYRTGESFEPMPRKPGQKHPDASIDDFVRLLDEARETTLDQLMDLTDDELRATTTWAGIDCDVRFRLMRFAQHEREHTAQIRKWRVQTGKPFSEAARYLGMCWQRSSRLESILCGAPDDILDRDPGDGEWPIRRVLAHIAGAERYFKKNVDDTLAKAG